MTRTFIGVIVGLVLGLTVVFGSFGEMLIVALFAIVGYVVAKVLDSDLDLGPYLPRRRNSR